MTARRARAHYPAIPGFKEEMVSKANAIRNRAKFNRKQKLVLGLFALGFEGTTREAGKRLGMDILSVRPRCTELLQMGLLEKYRVRDPDSGHSAWVLRLAERQTSLDLDDGQPTEQEEWHDYDADC